MTPPPTPTAMVDQENPWPGLASFTEDSRSFFFGREPETEELVVVAELDFTPQLLEHQ